MFFGNYCASSEDINDPSKIMHAGQFGSAFKLGDGNWYGETTRELFVWYDDESDASLIGKKLYQIELRHGRTSPDFTTKDRNSHHPTGLIFGTVVRVLNEVLVLLRCSDEWVTSAAFLENGRISGACAGTERSGRATPPPPGYEWGYSYNTVEAYDQHMAGVRDLDMAKKFPGAFARFAMRK